MKKALLIGINYFGQEGELNGCINDIVDMKKLCIQLGYNEIIMMHDQKKLTPDTDSILDTNIPFSLFPNKKNILSALKWIVSGLKSNDTLLIHYSGHGTQSISKTEIDGNNEALVPVDYTYNGIILDDELRNIIVQPNLNKTVKIRCILDCCHSGTGLDLKYNLKLPVLRNLSKQIKLDDMISKMVKEQVQRELLKYLDKDIVEKYMENKESEQIAETTETTETAETTETELIEWENNGEEKIIKESEFNKRVIDIKKFDIMMLSGCEDAQTSADASFGNKANGALTKTFLEIYQNYIKLNKVSNVLTFLTELRKNIKINKFTQIPQLSSENIFTSISKFDL